MYIFGNEKRVYTFGMVLPAAYEDWARSAAPAFARAGASTASALPMARLYVALWGYGLDPRITSLYRDPAHQQALRAAWDRGERAGLRTRPADPRTSAHTQDDFLGRPAARGIDIVTRDDAAAARVARSLGEMRAGYYFTSPDPGHYDV